MGVHGHSLVDKIHKQQHLKAHVVQNKVKEPNSYELKYLNINALPAADRVLASIKKKKKKTLCEHGRKRGTKNHKKEK